MMDDGWNEPPPEEPPKPSTQKKVVKSTPSTPIDRIVLALVICAWFFSLGGCLPVLGHTREKARRVNCAGNLKQIGLAMLMYSGENSGYFPLTPNGNNFEPLNTETILNDGKVYGCPSAMIMKTTAANSNYVYIGSGVKDDDPNPTSRVIAFDAPGNHPGDLWMNALFVDGHVEGAEPDGSKTWNDQDMLLAQAGLPIGPLPHQASPIITSPFPIALSLLLLVIAGVFARRMIVSPPEDSEEETND